MTRIQACLSLVLFSFSLARPAAGQSYQGGLPTAQNAAPVGTVTGQVLAQDTQLPVRFAQVLLQGVSLASADSGEAAGTLRVSTGSAAAVTGADGSFTATNVAPGDYYVIAGASGYISERALLSAALAAGAAPGDLLARIPTVHVSPESVSAVTVILQKGAAINGHVLWEDGSPAGGVTISASLTPTTTLPDALQQIRSPGSSGSTTTDDRGAFRLSGLASGNYLLQAILQNRAQIGGINMGRQAGSAIRLYAPGVFHKADAKPLTLRAGEERDIPPLIIDLHGLHTVSGHVTSMTAGLSVASGTVSLIDPADSSLRLMGSIDPHGEFAVQYVPPGNYTLQISGASTEAARPPREQGTNPESVTSFQPHSQSVAVSGGDLSGVTVALTPATGG